MKKEIKIIITLVIGLLMFGTKVSAAGKGICYDLPMLSGGYCQLKNPVNIYGKIFTKRPLLLSDGTDHTKYGYFGVVDGKNEDMFCIDSNLSQPGSTPYKYARPFNINEDYDRAIAKIYTMFVNDTAWLMQSRGISFKEASQDYIQITNIAMRAITKKYNYDIAGGYRKNIFKNVYSQFEGKNTSIPKLKEGTDAYKLAQKYYCSGLLSCKNCSSIIDAAAKKFCNDLPGVSTSAIRTFDIKITSTPDTTKEESKDSNEFSRVLDMKITGLKSFTSDYSTYAKTNPYFKITKVECENKKLKCELHSGAMLNADIIQGLSGDEYSFKVKVSGNRQEFLTETTGKVKVEYQFHHILNTNNLAVLRYALSSQTKQRMIALMPERPETAHVDAHFPIPAMCQTEIKDGEQIYKLGGTEVEELDYLQAGCCNIKSPYLKTKAAHDHYLEYCDVDVDIHLETECVNDADKDYMSHSFINQKALNKVIRNIDELEKNIENYSDEDYKNELSKYSFHQDDNYLYNPSENANDAISENNEYCKMYTSEKQDIYYPGTAEATSGRFFIFNNQPYINGEITGLFHTNIIKWEKDHDNAINKEKDAYNELQQAKNDEEIDDISSYELNYKNAQAARIELQKFKEECEGKSDVVNKWKYYFEPELYFNYQQKFYDPLTNKTQQVTEKVELEPSYKAEKYWPEVSDKNPILIPSEVEGKESKSTKIIRYGNYSESFRYDKTSDYKVGFKQRLYYIPKVKYYSLIPDGKYVTSLNEYQATNYLDVGYVFNVKITTYQGEYTTWFTVNSLGHLMQSPKDLPKPISNIQSLLNEYLAEHKDILNITDLDNEIDGSKFVNKCLYTDEEILYRRDCPTCEETMDSDFKVRYYTRAVANDNLFPNQGTADREVGANWNTAKAKEAKTLIEMAANEIYGDIDGSDSFLEYSFTLTPSKMQDVKKMNKQSNFSDFNLNCKSGLECESSLLTDLVKDSKKNQEILQKTRAEGWKYYINNTWVKGTIDKLFKNGYPDDDAGLTDWP